MSCSKYETRLVGKKRVNWFEFLSLSNSMRVVFERARESRKRERVICAQVWVYSLAKAKKWLRDGSD